MAATATMDELGSDNSLFGTEPDLDYSQPELETTDNKKRPKPDGGFSPLPNYEDDSGEPVHGGTPAKKPRVDDAADLSPLSNYEEEDSDVPVDEHTTGEKPPLDTTGDLSPLPNYEEYSDVPVDGGNPREEPRLDENGDLSPHPDYDADTDEPSPNPIGDQDDGYLFSLPDNGSDDNDGNDADLPDYSNMIGPPDEGENRNPPPGEGGDRSDSSSNSDLPRVGTHAATDQVTMTASQLHFMKQEIRRQRNEIAQWKAQAFKTAFNEPPTFTQAQTNGLRANLWELRRETYGNEPHDPVAAATRKTHLPGALEFPYNYPIEDADILALFRKLKHKIRDMSTLVDHRRYQRLFTEPEATMDKGGNRIRHTLACLTSMAGVYARAPLTGKTLTDRKKWQCCLEAMFWYLLRRSVFNSKTATDAEAPQYKRVGFGPAAFQYFYELEDLVRSTYVELLPEMHEMRARIATFLDRLHNSDHRFAATPDAETVNNIFGKSGVLHLIEPINIDTFLGQAIEVLYMATDLDTMFRRSLPDWRLEPDTSLNITGLLGFEFKSEKMEEVGRRDVPNPEDSPNYLHVTGTLVVVPRLVRFGNNEGRGYDQEVQIEKAEVVVDGLLE